MRNEVKTKTQLISGIESVRRKVFDTEQTGLELKHAVDVLSIVYDAIDSTVGGVIITDAQGNITYVNPSFLRMFGYADKSEVLGMNAAILFPGEEIRNFADVQVMIDVSDGDTEGFTVQTKDGGVCFVEVSSSVVRNSEGKVEGRMASFVDITKRKQLEQEKENLILELQNALNKIRTLRGLIPICARCKNIRDDKGYWHKVEEYVREHSEAQFSHGICPECSRKLYPQLYREV